MISKKASYKLNTYIFQLFTGRWNLQRQVAPNAHMRGIAIFKALSSMEKHYHEEGVWQPKPHQLIEFFQDYIYSLEYECIKIYKAHKYTKLDLCIP
jgi:hypothetical protein